MITYVLTVSESFPLKHKRAGIRTDFILSIAKKIKLHTIRGNYELWKKRFENIESGKACLSIRTWTGKPYNSKQVEQFKLYKSDGIGIQKLQSTLLGWFVDDLDSNLTVAELAKNDGLSKGDFIEWFKDHLFSEPKAIIHFTNFRY